MRKYIKKIKENKEEKIEVPNRIGIMCDKK